MSSQPPGITLLLRSWQQGEQGALDRLTPVVYAELHRLAARVMTREDPANTLQPTALVNEAWLRLAGVEDVRWQDRAHFFALAAQIMRRILVDAARARGAGKRGGRAVRFSLDDSIDACPEADQQLVALDDALTALAQFDPRKAQVVEMRFFAGLSVEETAAVLKITGRSVVRDWKLARAWILRELAGSASDRSPSR
jgi:RNA polymerase sigma factor (TIGR02999 family)